MFYLGIVEDNKDPGFLGRVRVRIYGKHTKNRSKTEQNAFLAVSDLPWAYTSQSVSISEISDFTPIPEGSLVVVTFLDTEEQNPFVIGCISSIENLPDFNEGFSDPNKKYPKSENVGRTSLSKFAVNDTEPASVSNKKSGVKSGSAHSDNITEPATQFAPEYGKNKVIDWFGNIIEIDATEGKERINIQHKSGAFIELHPDGDIVIHGLKDVYCISDGKLNIYSESNTNIHAGGDVNIESGGVVNLGKSSSLSGVVTKDCLCPITGQPHSDYSNDVLATKG